MSDDDEDWFEEAIGESGAADEERESDGVTEDTPGEESGDAFTGETPAEGGDEERPAEGPGVASGPDESIGEEPGAGSDSGGFFGESDAESDPFTQEAPGPAADDEESLFDEDFESAFESAGEEFDGEFESEIPRVDLGIAGLDAMIQGGVPEEHLIATIGAPGTGKTTFGLQFLHEALVDGGNAVFLTLEQSHEAIVDTAEEHGWEFEHYEAEGNLAIVDMDPIEMANSLDNIRGELADLIAAFDADRLVLDSVSLLEMMYDQQATRRTEVFDFTRSLKRAGVTTLLTSEASEDSPYVSRYGIVEYLTDAVFVLRYVRSEASETRLAVEIQKIRNANHSRESKPYEITDGGISVYQQASIF